MPQQPFKRGLLALFGLLMLATGIACADEPALAFWYADDPPVDELRQFDHIVVEPEHVSGSTLKHLQGEGRTVHAYVSIGELAGHRPWSDRARPEWKLGHNTDWDSAIMDLSSADWRQFLIEQRFMPLWQAGYRGFFLDTLDSYQGLELDETGRKRQQEGLVQLIREVHQRFPDAALLLNRGFEVIDAVADVVDGMVAESLYRGWDPATGEYRAVPEEDRDWLLKKLKDVHQRHPGLLMGVLDYLPPSEREQAREVAGRIRSLGFVPWVSTVGQDMLGVGAVEVLPRRVLMLYDSAQEEDGDIHSASIHVLAATPLEYLGYVPEYRDVRSGLPETPLRGRYAGVISWFGGPVDVPNLPDWLDARLDEGVPVLILGSPGFDPDPGFLERRGLVQVPVSGQGPWKPLVSDALVGFEAPVPGSGEETRGFLQLPEARNRVHLAVGDAAGQRHDVVITGAWGGIGLGGWLVDSGFGARNRWIIDPFALIRQALHLANLPMPDITTQNGRRLWLNHIDGDAFVSRAEMPGTPWSAEVIRDRILKRYRVPHTVSIVEGEIGPDGLYARHSPELERIARSIFRLPNVEPASHTWSHPYKWQTLREGMPSGGGYSLTIPGYRYDLEREIAGSIEYINRRLLSGGKRCRILLWSGDALPTEKALRIVHEHGYLNMNGGDTTIRRDRPWLAFVSPMARPVGPYLQVYAPIMNENVYTNEWTGPFYGFRRVIETFELTDRPRRLKPIDIYYHFYSGTKYAALNALETVYRWASRQETVPVYASEYIPLVEEFRRISIARRSDGRLQYRGIDRLRSLRLLKGGIDLSRSEGLAGMRQLHDGLYLHLAGNAPVLTLSSRPRPGSRPVLLQLNGFVDQWKADGPGKIRLRLHAHVPLEFEIGNVSARQCILRDEKGKRLATARAHKRRVHFALKGRTRLEGSLACR